MYRPQGGCLPERRLYTFNPGAFAISMGEFGRSDDSFHFPTGQGSRKRVSQDSTARPNFRTASLSA